MRGILAGLFAKSPFGPLSEHMNAVKKCVNLLKPMFEALIEQDHERVEDIANQISKQEHEADIIKNEIRNHLPKSIFLPVSRTDILNFLREQDAIADDAEDVGVLLTVRKTNLPAELKDELFAFLDKVLETFELTVRVNSELKLLMESSFGTAEVEKVLKLVDEIGHAEWETDSHQFRLAQKMFEMEQKLSPGDIIILLNVFRQVARLADHAQNVGDLLRLMISKG
ncbi:MAG: TIGR00153 family protein [Gemmatimonadota bacterium]|nr:MAG: TIGR00153 family protein [Gemmatimonadota bacterium]